MKRPIFPAEWSPHAATWFTWPTNVDTWTDVLDSVRRKLAEAMVHLAEGELVFVNVSSEKEARQVRDYTANHPNVKPLPFASNDSWCRDHGATFLLDGDKLEAVTWKYNAWGNKYPPFDLDNAMGAKMASFLGAQAARSNLTLEGGALESNGKSILLTTASCVLNQNRNSGLEKMEAEKELSHQLGLPFVGWLEGDLPGDDTDGHIDNLARFVNETTILMPKSLSTRQNTRELERLSQQSGTQLVVDYLPEANQLSFEGGPLPTSHMNFYIANSCVVLPCYGGPSDAEAAEKLRTYFPTRSIVQLDCKDVIRGLGAIHCLTQQVPMHAGFSASVN